MFGEMLVAEGLVSQAQLKEVLEIQRRGKSYAPLGEIFVHRRMLSRTELRDSLRKFKNGIPFGELLMNMKLITKEQLDDALVKQKETGKKLGEQLIDLGTLSELAFANALSLQLGIPKILPSIDIIDKSLLDTFNATFLRKHRFLPFSKEAGKLTVIMADPLDTETVALLEKVLKCELVLAIASAADIENSISLFYQMEKLGPGVAPIEDKIDVIYCDTDLLHEEGDKIVDMVNFIVTNAIRDRATDIHIEPQEDMLRVRYRIDGIMHHKTDLPSLFTRKLISRIKVISGLDIAEKRKHQDGRVRVKVMRKEYDLRVSTYSAIWGENIVIRIQTRNNQVAELDNIGFSPSHLAHFTRMLDHPSGIILVTGPTGSGKSTTLYASIQYLNNNDRVIITVEDPVEYTIQGVVQASKMPKSGVSYSDYLKSMMRQDPDVLMIGEIRDSEAAEAVIQASLTGHKVLSTFHTEDATGALLRLMDMGVETFLISSTLVSVVAQRLVRCLCEMCKAPYHPPATTLAFFTTISDRYNDELIFHKAVGCVHCNQSGYKGMTAIHELLRVNNAIRDAILQRSTNSAIKSIARQHANLITLSEDGFYKALLGKTSLEELIRVVYRDGSDGLTPITVQQLIEYCETDVAT